MLKKACAAFLLLLGLAFIASAEISYFSGDDQIDEIQKRIDEEKERQKKEKDKDKHGNADSDCFGEALGSCLEGVLRGICNSRSYSDSDYDSKRDSIPHETGDSGQCNIFGIIENLAYAPFPYAEGWGSDIVRRTKMVDQDSKPGFLTATVAGSYLFDNIISLTALLEANFFILHVNGFYQYSLAETKGMNIFSINGGISFPIQSILLNVYCGMFYYDYIGSPLFSFGASAKIFLPFNSYLDIYNLNSFFGSLGFHIITASLNYALDRFSIGGGYRFHSYAGVIMHGPEINLSVWL